MESYEKTKRCGGGLEPCQGRGRGFESLRPLQIMKIAARSQAASSRCPRSRRRASRSASAASAARRKSLPVFSRARSAGGRRRRSPIRRSTRRSRHPAGGGVARRRGRRAGARDVGVLELYLKVLLLLRAFCTFLCGFRISRSHCSAATTASIVIRVKAADLRITSSCGANCAQRNLANRRSSRAGDAAWRAVARRRLTQLFDQGHSSARGMARCARTQVNSPRQGCRGCGYRRRRRIPAASPKSNWPTCAANPPPRCGRAP